MGKPSADSCSDVCARRWLMVPLLCFFVAGLLVVGNYNISSNIYFNTSIPNVQRKLLLFGSRQKNVPVEKRSKMSKFRQNFLSWDRLDTVPFNDKPARTGKDIFMYQCGGFCGGWADQLKGTFMAYVIANLTGRSFKTRYLKPTCGVLNYVVPNKVDWYLNESFQIPKNQSHYNHYLGRGMLKRMVGIDYDFKKKWKLKKKYELFLGNLQYLKNMRYNKAYYDQLAWMRDMDIGDVYGAIYKRLFKLSPKLQNRLQKILNKELPTEKHRLLCIHVRLGHEAFGSDWARRNSVENLPRIWEWMNNMTKSDLDKIFVMSDSPTVINSAYNQSFADRLVTVPGAIIHSNKFNKKNMTRICQGLERLYLEHHMLMNCDILVKGHSGLSVIAGMVRGTDEGLYCLQDNGTITPCQRGDLWAFI